MSVFLRFERLVLVTDAGEDVYEFKPGLNAVVGSYGTGKSSMFELIKFGLGGRAKIMPKVSEHLERVELSVTVGAHRLTLVRQHGRNLISVKDRGDDVGEVWCATAGKHPRAGVRLLELLGLEPARLAKRSTSGSASEPITFFDFYRYVYLPQNDVDTSVAGHADPFTNRKRRAVFEYAYGLADDYLRELGVEASELERQVKDATAAVAAVRAFIERIGQSDEEELDAAEARAQQELSASTSRLVALRSGVQAAAGGPAELRSTVSRLRLAVGDAESELTAARVGVDRGRALLAQLALDQERLRRADRATLSLSGLEFNVCPRCLQAVDARDVPEGACLLCTQPQPRAAEAAASNLAALRRLEVQRTEAEALLHEDERRVEAALHRLAALRAELDDAAGELERYAADVVAPSLDDSALLARQAEQARYRIREIERARDIWHGLHQQELALERVKIALAENAVAQREATAALERNRYRVTELGELFDEEIRELRWAGYASATIDAKTYLPMVNGDPFDKLSVGGARKTLANVAYYLANLGYSLSNADIRLPGALLIDSPRKNLGDTPEDTAAGERIYYRLSILAASYPNTQVIVADNGLPPGMPRPERDAINVIELSYGRPLLQHVPHPGPGVETIADG